MSRSGTWLFLYLLLPALAWAQTAVIQGTVMDARTETPLPGINVYLQGTTVGTATDPAGWFVISRIPPGSYVLVVSAVGFRRIEQPVTLSPGDTLTFHFRLEEVTLMSGEIVITASRREEVRARVPISLHVLSPRDLEMRNVLTLDEALRYVPGVQMADNQVNIRGATGFAYGVGSRVLLLVDGVPLLGPDRGDIKFDALPMSEVRRVEVYKGPGSALYGGSALSGVVNLITRAFPDTPTTTCYTFAGGYFPPRYEVWRRSWEGGDEIRPYGGVTLTHARKVSERLGFWVHGFLRRDTGYMENSARMDAQAFFKLGWRLSGNHRLDMLGGYVYNRSQQFLFWQSLRAPFRMARSDFARGGNEGISEYFTLLPVWHVTLSPKWLITLRGRLFSTAFKPVNEEGRVRPRSEHTYATRYGGDVQITGYLKEGRTLILGASGDMNEAESEFYLGEDNKRQRFQPEAAAYAQWEEQWKGGWHITVGVRWDYYLIDRENTVTRLTPRLGVTYEYTDQLILRGAVGQGFRVPSLAERFVNNREFIPIIPNVKLKPEESMGYELGMRYLLPLGAKTGVQLDVAAFWNEFKNLVDPRFRPDENAFQFVNVTRARIRGIEATVQGQLAGGHLDVLGAYTYLDHRDLTEDAPLPYRSRHLLQLTLNARPRAHVVLGMDVRYMSKPERIESEGLRFVADADRMVPIRVVDLRGGYQTDRYQVNILLKNALDYYYVERPAKMAPPRHLTLQVRWRF